MFDTSTEFETTRSVLLKDFAQCTREGEIQDVGPLHLGLSYLDFGERPCQFGLQLQGSKEATASKGVEEFASPRCLLECLPGKEEQVFHPQGSRRRELKLCLAV